MKRKIFLTRASIPAFALAFVLFMTGNALAGAQIFVINVDGPNEGFNDPTPVAPVGGNSGTTKGQQRLIAFQFAADRWGATIDSPVPIIIQSSFDPLGANVLGSAGATVVFRDFGSVGLFPGAGFPGTWYGSALADKRAGADLNPGAADIRARFSSDFDFYLGLDNNHGTKNDLVTVLLHEFAHGLGFQTFVSPSTGANLGVSADNPQGFTDVFARYLVDSTNGLHWNDMTLAQRQASAVKFGRLVWDGSNVNNDVSSVLLFGSPDVRVTSPAAISGPYQFGTAAFGPVLSSPGISGTVVAAVDAADAAGPATTDGCSAFTNAAAVAGHIALIERGTCGFAVKARNATNAGATAVIIYNNSANAAAAPPGMADDGINGPFVTVPTISLTRADGLSIVGQLGVGVSLSIGVDPNVRAGADDQGRARLYAPFPVVSGSSVSHYDTVARRNLLMEPNINPDLTHNLKAPDDLTLELLTDVGWFADSDNDGVTNTSDCNPNSNLSDTVVIDGRDTGAPNYLFQGGCTSNDYIASFAVGAKNHGVFVSRVAAFANALLEAGLITEEQKDAIMSAAGESSIGGRK